MLPHAKLVAEQVSAQLVMEARRADMAEGSRQEDVAQLVDGVEPGSEMNITLPPTEPNVVQLGSEQLMPSLVAPTIDVTGQPQ